MAKNTSDLQKMKTAAGELEKIYTGMQQQINKLDENVSRLSVIWAGAAADTYINSYAAHINEIQSMGTAIRTAASTLSTIVTTYDKTDAQAAEIVKQKLARG